MDTDRNLLFGVLALQADLISPSCFVEACTLWASHKQTPLADLLVQRGWLTPADRADVERLLQRKLKKHNGDAHASLAEVASPAVRESLAGLADVDIRQSLDGATTITAPPRVLAATTDYTPQARDRYTLTRLHATGGIGRVWLARDGSLGRDVALKELRPERADSPMLWDRFLKEAQITGQLEHPGIVPIYEMGRRPEDQAPFYTMRFVRGRTLAQVVAGYHQRRAKGEAGPLELRELLTAFVGVCNAVAYAHSRGVLHRDLKPNNVVLGDYGEVIVLDWGLAKILGGEPAGDLPPLAVGQNAPYDATMHGQVLGTPAYMAPEQAEGRVDQLGPAADVYGLGAILYEILTGQPPFTGPDTATLLRQVVHEMPTPPRSLVKDVPRPLQAICLQALNKKPSARYASAKELAEEVRRWLADEPVTAYREPWMVRTGRWVKRHRTLVTSVSAAMLAAGIGLAVVLAIRREGEQREAAAHRRVVEARVAEAESYERQALNARERRHREDAIAWLSKARDVLAPLNLEDRRHRKQQARLAYNLATMHREAGKVETAHEFYQETIDAYAGLAAEEPDDAESHSDLAQSYSGLGTLRRETGRLDESLAAYEQAFAWQQKAAVQAPANVSMLLHLAQGRSIVDLGGNLARR